MITNPDLTPARYRLRPAIDIAEAIRRRLNATTTEETRKALDAEHAKVARRFDALVGIGFREPARRQ
jgi:hypothetical protein